MTKSKRRKMAHVAIEEARMATDFPIDKLWESLVNFQGFEWDSPELVLFMPIELMWLDNRTLESCLGGVS